MEERLKVTDFVERFKLAIVSANPSEWVPRMFPQWASPGAESSEDLDLDSIEGEELVFTEQVTPEEAEELLREMTANPGGVIGFDDLPDDSEDW